MNNFNQSFMDSFFKRWPFFSVLSICRWSYNCSMHKKNSKDHQSLESDLHKIHLWTVKNKPPLHASKCTVVHFSRSKYFQKIKKIKAPLCINLVILKLRLLMTSSSLVIINIIFHYSYIKIGLPCKKLS